MERAEIPSNDTERVEALESYNILDTLPEKEYDDITRLATQICEAPVSLISLIDTSRQWFKSKQGMTLTESSRDYAFCAHAINRPDEMMVVKDSKKDIRFYDNPFVTTEPGIQFYAGVPLTNKEGFTLGTLCIIDDKPRELSDSQAASLKALGNLVVKLFELRRSNQQLKESRDSIKKMNDELHQFSYVISHDIRSPLNNIMALAAMLKSDHMSEMDGSGADLVGHIEKSVEKLRNFTDGIIAYYRDDTSRARIEEVDLTILIRDIIQMLDGKKEFEFHYPHPSVLIKIDKTGVQQVLINMISNAMKYNDKAHGVITITFAESAEFYELSVRDNGVGIAHQDFEKIFNVFETLGKKDRYQSNGTGIGLSSVKKLVERMGGSLRLASEPGKGSTFSFTIQK